MRIGYLLYDEGYSGVIESQALDVVRFFITETDYDSILIAALPFRTHRQVKRRFEESLGTEIVTSIAVPQRMQTVLQRLEIIRLTRILKKENVDILICRNAMACSLALKARKMIDERIKTRIYFDGRGALKAEAQEYKVYPEFLKPLLFEAERNAVLNSDFRIAVTRELVDWWKSEYGYNLERHAVIPTTISTLQQNFAPSLFRKEWRAKFGFKPGDVVMAFAGGKAEWQGMDFWLPHMRGWLANVPNLKLLLLTPENPSIAEIRREYPNHILRSYVSHSDVLKALSAADYGILWRNPSITNIVASPTKLSEYVQAGLTVVTNQGTAVSRLIQSKKLGICIHPEFQEDYINQLTEARKDFRSFRLAKMDFFHQLIPSLDE